MLHDQILVRLRQNEFFGLFPSHVRTPFLNKCETRVYKAGKVLFERGEEGPWMGAILAGRVRILLRSADNKEMLLSIFERGEIFGERSLLDGRPRGADAIADEDTTILVVKRDDIMPLLFQYPDAMYVIVKMLCNRLLRYTETMALYTLQNLPQRLASYLLFLAGAYGHEVDGQMIIRAGLNQSDLGKKLAATRESINRQLKNFETQGFIRQDGSEIVIVDRAGLQNFCEAPTKD